MVVTRLWSQNTGAGHFAWRWNQSSN